MRRAGAQAAPDADVARPAAAAQMHTGAEFGSKAWFSGDHQGEPPRPAEPHQIAPQRLAVRFAVMAENDAAQPAWECRDRGARVG